MRTAAVFFVFSFCFVALLVPATASAVTVPEIMTLSKAGVSDAVLIALIARDKQVFSIDADELVALKREGVSDAVVLAMLKSGREQAAASILPAPAAPAIVVIGHDPDRPNTTHEFESAAPLVPFFVVPYVFVGPAGPIDGRGACARFAVAPTVSPQAGRITSNSVGHLTGDSVGHMTSNNIGFIWTPPAPTAAVPVAPCERIVARAPARPRR